MITAETRMIAERVERIRPILAGLEPEQQGAVLADLLAIWLAGHHVPGDQAASRELRKSALETHLELMWPLVAVNARIIGAPP